MSFILAGIEERARHLPADPATHLKIRGLRSAFVPNEDNIGKCFLDIRGLSELTNIVIEPFKSLLEGRVNVRDLALAQ